MKLPKVGSKIRVPTNQGSRWVVVERVWKTRPGIVFVIHKSPGDNPNNYRAATELNTRREFLKSHGPIEGLEAAAIAFIERVPEQFEASIAKHVMRSARRAGGGA